jgi:hypothetical protein
MPRSGKPVEGRLGRVLDPSSFRRLGTEASSSRAGSSRRRRGQARGCWKDLDRQVSSVVRFHGAAAIGLATWAKASSTPTRKTSKGNLVDLGGFTCGELFGYAWGGSGTMRWRAPGNVVTTGLSRVKRSTPAASYLPIWIGSGDRVKQETREEAIRVLLDVLN